MTRTFRGEYREGLCCEKSINPMHLVPQHFLCVLNSSKVQRRHRVLCTMTSSNVYKAVNRNTNYLDNDSGNFVTYIMYDSHCRTSSIKKSSSLDVYRSSKYIHNHVATRSSTHLSSTIKQNNVALLH